VQRSGRERSAGPRAAPETAPARLVAEQERASQRLDKWLWFARFARTRSLAARLVEDGKVRVNREKIIKPAQSVRPGDVITAAIGGRVRVVRIVQPGGRRGPAEEARGLYEDLTPPDEPTAAAPGMAATASGRAPGAGRPTKRERRKLDAARAQAERDERSSD
jgi:ribosome-associated heat shock protein Hsp15